MAMLSSNLTGFIPKGISSEIITNIVRGSAVLQLGKVREMKNSVEVIPFLSAGAGAYFIGEGAAITVADATWVNADLAAKKIAVIIPMSREALKDSTQDVFEALKPQIAEDVAQAFDGAALFGTNSPYGATNSIVTAANAVGQSTELTVDLGAPALSTLMGVVETAGFDVNGFVLGTRHRPMLRAANLATSGQVIYESEKGDAPALIHGIPAKFKSNYVAKASSEVIVGNWNYALTGIMGDIEYTVLQEGTVGTYNLAEMDMVAIRAVARIGFLVVKGSAFANYKDGTANA